MEEGNLKLVNKDGFEFINECIKNDVYFDAVIIDTIAYTFDAVEEQD